MKNHGKVFFISIALILLLLTAGCVLPGTGTVRIRNEFTGGQDITALYLYLSGNTDKGSSIISSPIYPNNTYTKMGVDPGEYIIEAALSTGETAFDNTTVEEGQINIVWLRDSDIQ